MIDLTKPGLWIANDGTLARVAKRASDGKYCVTLYDARSFAPVETMNAEHYHDFRYWTEVKFTPPILPAKPKEPPRCLLSTENGLLRWRSPEEMVSSHRYTLVPHDQNDPEAVEFFNNRGAK